jgi:hypothetical protein
MYTLKNYKTACSHLKKQKQKRNMASFAKKKV